jgi:hypothetical protein
MVFPHVSICLILDSDALAVEWRAEHRGVCSSLVVQGWSSWSTKILLLVPVASRPRDQGEELLIHDIVLPGIAILKPWKRHAKKKTSLDLHQLSPVSLSALRPTQVPPAHKLRPVPPSLLAAEREAAVTRRPGSAADFVPSRWDCVVCGERRKSQVRGGTESIGGVCGGLCCLE